jgi:predicted transcriptional regulator
VIMLERREKVAALYLSGKPQWKIGQMLGVTQMTVSNDLAALRKQWMETAQMEFSQRLAEELARIDEVEVMAREAYELSKRDAVTVHIEREKMPRPTRNGIPRNGRTVAPNPTAQNLEVIREVLKKTKKGQSPGHEVWVGRICWCIEMRCKLLGILKPDKTNVNVIQINWDDLAGRAAEDDGDDVERLIQQKVQGAIQ